MKFIDEYRDAAAARSLAVKIRETVTRPWTLMEVCGGQTHSILKFGLDELLPPEVTLIHGPGCPVCVTPIDMIDRAIAIARRPEVILCSFGDMLRVPGSDGDLFRAKSEGADVRVLYSPMEALELARRHPDREVVFFAVGFETTAPANAMPVHQAKREGLTNFSLLVSHVLVPPAIEAILSDPDNRVQGFLAAGHVCAVMGYEQYEPLAAKHGVPIVVTGFEPMDILQGVLMCVRQLEEGRSAVENQYARSVNRAGNARAQQMLADVFTVTARNWRGIGEIPESGFRLASEYQLFDAMEKFAVGDIHSDPDTECRSGEVLQGRIKPTQCEAFGTRCTPEHPLGATMVSGEGACAAYYRYRREGTEEAR
jgi:hydrogenase expression/formation protein HypD